MWSFALLWKFHKYTENNTGGRIHTVEHTNLSRYPKQFVSMLMANTWSAILKRVWRTTAFMTMRQLHTLYNRVELQSAWIVHSSTWYDPCSTKNTSKRVLDWFSWYSSYTARLANKFNSKSPLEQRKTWYKSNSRVFAFDAAKKSSNRSLTSLTLVVVRWCC